MFFKTAAKRTPSPAPAAPAAAPAAAPSGPFTVEALGQQLREVLPTRRLQSISLCDHEANVLWLSEGALGPDEHSLVTEALALLAADTSLPCHEMGLEDGRLALFLPVRAPNGSPVGIAMILADRKSVGDDTLERITAAPVRAIMQRLAVLLRPSELRASTGTARVPILELPDEPQVQVTQPLPPLAARIPTITPPPPAANGAVAVSAVITPEQIDDILEFEHAPEAQPAAAASAAAHPFADQRQQPSAATAAVSDPLDMLNLEFEEPMAPTGPAARPAPPAAAAAAPTMVAPPRVVPTLAPVARVAAPAPQPVAAVRPPAPPPAPAPVVAPVRAAAPKVAPSPPPAPAVLSSAVLEASEAAVNDPNLVLELLPFAKLRAGGQTRRFQVLAHSTGVQRDPAAFDALVLQRLLGWLAAHRASWNSQPTSFTVNLSIATLEDERFAQKIAAALNTHGIAAETIGFEIAEALCTQRRAQVERFMSQCDKVGSWVVIDNFSFDSQVLTLLRSKALRLVKIDSKLTSSALKDKLSQAMVVATVQAAKVLGIHCSAQKVDSQAALQWLTAIGCDFAQGHALARPQPLDALASSPDPTGISAMALPT